MRKMRNYEGYEEDNDYEDRNYKKKKEIERRQGKLKKMRDHRDRFEIEKD